MSSDPVSTLSRHGKSFRFAGMFLSSQQLHQAARLYQFCRWVDDIADESEDKLAARASLVAIQRDIRDNRCSGDEVSDFLALQQELSIPCSLPLQLIDGVLSDLQRVAFKDERQLLRYAYRVAGVVGLMMCPILKADKAGYAYAVDLGIAMQLTNIARDVWEDATLRRRYLPWSLCRVSAEDILEDSPQTRLQVQGAITRVLKLAECYYASGYYGFRFLPAKSRRAIAVAAAVYRHIGIKLQRQGTEYWRGRTVVPTSKKIVIAAQTLLSSTANSFGAEHRRHPTELHRVLEGLLPDWALS